MITVYFDGACEPINPGGTMSFGVAIFDGEEVIHEYSSLVFAAGSQPTNNVAEYSALEYAIKWLIDNELSNRAIEILGDSQLVIFQMFGDPRRGGKKWQIRGGAYVEVAKNVSDLLGKLRGAGGRWIPREQNTRADELSMMALASIGVKARTRK